MRARGEPNRLLSLVVFEGVDVAVDEVVEAVPVVLVLVGLAVAADEVELVELLRPEDDSAEVLALELVDVVRVVEVVMAVKVERALVEPVLVVELALVVELSAVVAAAPANTNC